MPSAPSSCRLERGEDHDVPRGDPAAAVPVVEQQPGGHPEGEEHGGERRRGQRAQRERAPPPRRARGPLRRGAVEVGQGRRLRRLLPGRGLEPFQLGDERHQSLRLGAQTRVVAELGLECRPLLGIELAEQIAGEALVAHRASSSSIRSRRRASACTIRIFTVPSGMPVASAISRWLRPP